MGLPTVTCDQASLSFFAGTFPRRKKIRTPDRRLSQPLQPHFAFSFGGTVSFIWERNNSKNSVLTSTDEHKLVIFPQTNWRKTKEGRLETSLTFSLTSLVTYSSKMIMKVILVRDDILLIVNSYFIITYRLQSFSSEAQK